MRHAALVALLAAVAPSAGAQQAPDPDHPAGQSFTTRTAGMSWYSPRAARWGKVTDRRLYLLGIGRERAIAFPGASTLMLTQEIPVAVIERVPGPTQYCYIVDGNCIVDRGRKLSVGIGVMPLGLKWTLPLGNDARLVGTGAAGLLFFTSDTPVDQSKRRNFALEAGGGLAHDLRNGSVITFGFKFHHVSNAGTGIANPGLDANVVYVSLSRPRAAKH